MGLFGRKKSTDHTAELIAEAQRSFSTDTTGFRLPVADVFEITGRGTVVTGTIEAGSVHKGAKVRLTRADGTSREVTVTGVEMFRKLLDSAGAGDNVGLLLDRTVKRSDIARGDVLSG